MHQPAATPKRECVAEGIQMPVRRPAWQEITKPTDAPTVIAANCQHPAGGQKPLADAQDFSPPRRSPWAIGRSVFQNVMEDDAFDAPWNHSHCPTTDCWPLAAMEETSALATKEMIL
jgi:hypothetical protein